MVGISEVAISFLPSCCTKIYITTVVHETFIKSLTPTCYNTVLSTHLTASASGLLVLQVGLVNFALNACRKRFINSSAFQPLLNSKEFITWPILCKVAFSLPRTRLSDGERRSTTSRLNVILFPLSFPLPFPLTIAVLLFRLYGLAEALDRGPR